MASKGKCRSDAFIAVIGSGRKMTPEEFQEFYPPLLNWLRVCPKTSGGITKFSEHEAD
jgi:hypothetical protein